MSVDSSTPSRTLSRSGTATTARNNPISLRIYKAIGTSFDDPGSREALEIASSFYAPSSSGTSKGKALSDDELGKEENGEPGSEVVMRRTLRGQSAAMARKCLKRDIEGRMAGGSRRFLEAFGEVDQKLDVLREHMQEMQVRCDQVQAELDQANSGTKYLLERADGLRSQRASAQLRATIIGLFLSRFTLSESEHAALASREVAVGPELFRALDRVAVIRKDCRSLLGGEEGKMQAGLDIMALTSEQMESAYLKIHRWCLFEFRQFSKDAQLEVSPNLREAVRRLRDRPALLKEALSTLTSTRQSSLLQSFLDALTRGGPQGLPRPIELHAHDPQRYVGDMLAWVHQSTASEHEFLEGLFGVGGYGRMVGQERFFKKEQQNGNGHTTDETLLEGDEQEQLRSEEELVGDCLDKDLEGLARPLKMRIQQTIKSQEGIIMAYKIANLVQFYLVTMRKTIGVDAMLSKSLQEIYQGAQASFFETLDAQGRSLLRFLHPPDATLTPPLALRDSTQILRELIGVYDTSLVDPEERANDASFKLLCEKAVEPAVEMCEKMADMRKNNGGEWERDIFLINCLSYLQRALEDFDFTEEQWTLLDKKIGGFVESMTFEHHGRLLDQCGLGPIMKAIRTRPADTPLSRLPATASKPLTTALTTFSSFLSNIDPSTHPTLDRLTSRTLATRIHKTALRRISEAYGEICERVLDEKEGYEFRETLLRRGRAEVEVALGVVGEDEEEE
ncbi:putative intra-golgi transport-related protein [Naematelia encephala]|uniref:Conserved oligomeric Golgi complex subunit 6 n=1 Tax=Naematelia encephala TaxID=71784 RepID=A0A1Y2AFW1_9TREE|nr:putative intra-golgi transport-related protein [Naematelia encephala]